MKTAAEWLIDTINKINHDYEMGIIDETLWSIQTYDAHNQAKEMEKDQIMDAMDWIMNKYFEFHEQPTTSAREQYYNETFKSE